MLLINMLLWSDDFLKDVDCFSLITFVRLSHNSAYRNRGNA